ncbi:hypothetical protein ACTXLO_14355 [Psychrobacter alimentarius]|uniref:hypothetical protein n=1 Tax=Psychrobacter alimentarius TaxID=261164 RepID=UPI003FD5ED66
MSEKEHVLFEKHIVNLFNDCEELYWKGVRYDEIKAFKPRTNGGNGECKTDIYVSLMASGHELESIKISAKLNNADFLGNKLSIDDAKNLFGSSWSSTLQRYTNSLSPMFLESEVLTKKTYRGVKDVYFLLGWKLEISNKNNRSLVVQLNLPKRDIVNKVYRGFGQPTNRLNAVDPEKNIIINSGIADYLLEGSRTDLTTVETVINKLESFLEYDPPPVYLIFTANNYRVIAKKADGPRTLAVSIDWQTNDEDTKLVPIIVFNNPLAKTGQNDVLPVLKSSLEKLNIDLEAITSETVDSFSIDWL